MLILFSCNQTEKTENSIPFEKLTTEYTGVNFSNNITPNLESSENLFDYDYFYNGSGVGIADINNCLLYTSPSPRDRQKSRMPSSA